MKAHMGFTTSSFSELGVKACIVDENWADRVPPIAGDEWAHAIRSSYNCEINCAALAVSSPWFRR